jgi:hypothetical protein
MMRRDIANHVVFMYILVNYMYSVHQSNIQLLLLIFVLVLSSAVFVASSVPSSEEGVEILFLYFSVVSLHFLESKN